MKKIIGLFSILSVFFFSGCASLEVDSGDDSNLAAQVSQRLSTDPVTAALRLGIAADDGVIILSGRIDNPSVRLRALSIARSTPGVTDVEDQTVRY